MNKELIEWLDANNPYDKDGGTTGFEFQIWEEGAVDMHNYLEEKNRQENDAAFLLGIDSAKNQPPTAEQLVKAFKLFYSDKVEQEDLIDKDSNFEPIVKQILEHWNDDRNDGRLQ